MSMSDETTTTYYPCGGANGCGHRVDGHGMDGCGQCPCEYTPEDWLRAFDATNARLRERVVALERGVTHAHHAIAAHTCTDAPRWTMDYLDLLSVGREAEMPADMRCDCADVAALTEADERQGGER